MSVILELLNNFFEENSKTIMKFSFAALIGVVIGIEREIKRKQVGIKTLICIAVGSALLTTVSIDSVTKYALLSGDNIRMDPMRLAAQIISGIGFLGAGVIMHKANDSISGLTTAAIIWVVSGIGIAIGAEFYAEALLAVIFYLFGLDVIPGLIYRILRLDVKRKAVNIKLKMPRGYNTKNVLNILKGQDIKISKLRITDEKENKKIVEIKGYISIKEHVSDIYDKLSLIEDLEKIDIQE